MTKPKPSESQLGLFGEVSAAPTKAEKPARPRKDLGTIPAFDPRLVELATHIAQVLAELVRLNGYEGVVIDPRTAFAAERRFPTRRCSTSAHRAS